MIWQVQVTDEVTGEVTLLSLSEFEQAFNDNLISENETIKFLN